jgi:hypothetical protein
MEDLCQVWSGIHEGLFPVAGMTVRYMRRLVGPIVNLRPDCQVVINGVEVDDDYVIPPGSVISSIKPEGRKGLGNLLTPDQIKRRWRISERQYRELCTRGLPTITLDGESRHPEEAVDEWFRRLFDLLLTPAQIVAQHSANVPIARPVPPRSARISVDVLAGTITIDTTTFAGIEYHDCLILKVLIQARGNWMSRTDMQGQETPLANVPRIDRNISALRQSVPALDAIIESGPRGFRITPRMFE